MTTIFQRNSAFRLYAKEALDVLLLVFFVSFTSFTLLFYLPGDSETLRKGLSSSSDIQQRTITIISSEGRSEVVSYAEPEQSDDVNVGVVELFCGYRMWLTSALNGDFGNSEYSQERVSVVIAERVWVSIGIAIVSVSLSLLLAILWCWAQEIIPRKLVEKYGEEAMFSRRIVRAIEITGDATEKLLLSFVPLSLSIVVLSIISAFRLSLLNLNIIQKSMYPILVLVLLNFPLYTRSLKKSMEMVSRSPYVQFAHSLGFSRTWIWWREMLPNAFVFTLTLSVIQFSYLVGGTILVEKIFAVPGLGSKLIDAVESRDRAVVQCIVVLIALIIGIVHAVFNIYREKVYGKSV